MKYTEIGWIFWGLSFLVMFFNMYLLWSLLLVASLVYWRIDVSYRKDIYLFSIFIILAMGFLLHNLKYGGLL